MKKLFLWTFVLTLLCTWAVVGADQTPITPTTSSAPKAEKERPAQEMLSGKASLSNVAPVQLAVPAEAEAEIQQAEPAVMQAREFALPVPVKAPYTGPENVPDPNVILQGGDRCEDATPIPAIPYTDNGTTVGYTNDYDEVCFFTGSTSPDVVYSYTPEADICVDITLCIGQTDYDTKLYIYEDVCQDPGDGQEPYACNDDYCSAPYNYDSELYGVAFNVGHTYYIVVDGYGTASGNYTIDITEVDCPVDPCENAIYHNGEPDGVNGYSCERHISQGWDSWVVDDVELLEETHISDIHWWTIDMGITWNGTDDLIILADAGGVPGATVVEMYDLPNFRYDTGEFIFGYPVYLYTLYVDITLPAGYYWLGVRPVSDDGGQSFWATAPLTGSEVYFKSAYFGYPDWTSGFDAWGEYQNVAFCLTDEPVQTGACCDDLTGICQDGVPVTECPPPLRFAANTLCANLDPLCGEQPTGACCDPATGDCLELTALECADAFGGTGQYQGDGTDCDPNPCEQPCIVECPPESYIEQEACGDDVNGGCNMIPPPPQYWEPIESGMTVCGTAWADADFRDTDWYVYELTEYSTVTWDLEAEFASQPIFFTSNTDCVTNTYEYAFLDPCTPYQFQAILPPGEHWLWMGDQAFAGNPCGGGNDDYVFTLTCEPLQPCENIVTVEILTDDYPTETTWDLVYVATGEVVGSGGPYSDPQTMYTAEACIDGDPTGCYLFTIYDSFGDGISLPPGFYSVYDPAFVLVCSGGGDFGYEESCYFGACEPAACCIGSTCEDLTPQECADAGGTWYYGEDCATFDCPTPPIDCDDAVYHNGNSIGGAFASQCDTEYPMQAEVCDDFILPGDVPIEVTSIVGGMGFWNRTPPADPSELESVIFDIYNDAGGVPGGNPVDMDPDCAREGDIVWTHEYAQGQFGYMEEPAGYWRIWVEVAPGELTLQPGVTYWIGWAGRHFFSTTGQGGPQPTDQLTGSPCLLYFPLLGYDVWTDVWGQDIGFCINGIPSGPPPCDYIPGDCNHSGVALELADVIAMIGMYRGTVTPAYTCDCPPHGATFAPEADPNGNCVALELADVVAEIAAYRGTGIAYGCVDCPGDGPPPPLLGKEGTSVIPSLKSKVKTTQQGSAD